MKKCFYTVCLISFTTTTAQAQEKPLLRTPKFVAGIHAGVSRECLNEDSARLNHFGYKHHLVYPVIGLFARYSIGSHVAIQVGADYNLIKQTEYETSIYMPGVGTAKLARSVSTTAIDVPVLLQYHLQSRDNKIRPYFSAGLTTRFLQYKMEGKYVVGLSDTPYSEKESRQEFYPTIGQGVIWQLNKHWQINEAASYMFNNNSSVLSLKIGLAYTIK